MPDGARLGTRLDAQHESPAPTAAGWASTPLVQAGGKVSSSAPSSSSGSSSGSASRCVITSSGPDLPASSARVYAGKQLALMRRRRLKVIFLKSPVLPLLS